MIKFRWCVDIPSSATCMAVAVGMILELEESLASLGALELLGSLMDAAVAVPD